MKRRLAFLLILAAFVGMISPVGAAISAEDKYDILCAFGFFDEDAVYSGTASVTRSEIITALVNSMPEEKLYKINDADSGFVDVAASDPIAEIAYNARMLGIMGSETELRPYDQATLEDASFMILNLLGYGQAAGGNYSSYAASLGLTKQMSSSSSFTMDQLVIMLYNALDTEVMQWSIQGPETTLGTVDGETYMTELLEAGRSRGFVSANKFAGIGGTEATGSDSVVIDGSAYYVGTTGAMNFLGYTVDFYYRFDDNDEAVIIWIKTYDEDSVVEFDSEAITAFEDMTYTYETGIDGGRLKRARLLKSADIIYNGKIVSGDFDSYMPEEGHIKLIDNDNDKEYEIAVITEYEVVVVSNVDQENGVISNLNYPEKEYRVDLYDPEPKYSVCFADGRIGKFSDIYKYYTIFIAESMDKELCTIIISDKKVKGSINLWSPEKIQINGIAYEPTDEFLQFNDVKLGSYGTFYLDPKGRLGAYEGLVDRSIKAGYLLRAAKDDSGLEEDTLILKLFAETGDVETLYTADTLFYTNGLSFPPIRAKADNADVVLEALNAAADESIGGGQLILYKQNGQGRVTDIEIAAKYTLNLEEAEELNRRGSFRQITEKLSQINHKNGLFLLDFRIGPDTKVISVPADIDNTDKFEVYTGTTNCFEWNKRYTVVAFSKNSNSSYADYVLGFLSGADGALDEDNVFVVQSVSQAINADNMPVKVIKGMWGAAEVEYMLDEELSEQTINSGDILRLGFDDMGNVTNISKVFDYEKQTPGATGSLTDKYYSYFGYAYDMQGSTLKVALKDPAEVTLTNELINTFADKMEAIYRYDTKTKKITTIGYGDIKTYNMNPGGYSKVFAWFYYADHKMMVVYD